MRGKCELFGLAPGKGLWGTFQSVCVERGKIAFNYFFISLSFCLFKQVMVVSEMSQVKL